MQGVCDSERPRAREVRAQLQGSDPKRAPSTAWVCGIGHRVAFLGIVGGRGVSLVCRCPSTGISTARALSQPVSPCIHVWAIRMRHSNAAHQPMPLQPNWCPLPKPAPSPSPAAYAAGRKHQSQLIGQPSGEMKLGSALVASLLTGAAAFGNGPAQWRALGPDFPGALTAPGWVIRSLVCFCEFGGSGAIRPADRATSTSVVARSRTRNKKWCSAAVVTASPHLWHTLRCCPSFFGLQLQLRRLQRIQRRCHRYDRCGGPQRVRPR